MTTTPTPPSDHFPDVGKMIPLEDDVKAIRDALAEFRQWMDREYPDRLDRQGKFRMSSVQSLMEAAWLAAITAQALPAAEPVGYFKAEPFGWTDCAPTAEGAIALYEHPQQAAQATAGWVSVNVKAPTHITLDVALSDGTVTTGELFGDLGWHWDQTDDEEEDAHITHWKLRPTHPQPQPQSAQTKGDAA